MGNICPGCGRCRDCGHPLPYNPYPWLYYPWWTPPYYPTITWEGTPNTPYVTGVDINTINITNEPTWTT